MKPAILLTELRARGATVEARGERLRIDAPDGVLRPRVLAAVKASKRELMALLEAEAKPAAVESEPQVLEVPPDLAPSDAPAFLAVMDEARHKLTAGARADGDPDPDLAEIVEIVELAVAVVLADKEAAAWQTQRERATFASEVDVGALWRAHNPPPDVHPSPSPPPSPTLFDLPAESGAFRI